jgi:DNA-binding GntR family transcriptional regulator
MGYMVCVMAPDRPVFDPGSVTPLYEQAADYIDGQIRARELVPGQKLPAERDLADEWGIGYQTVRRAMRELRERGLIISRVGKGTFVAGNEEAPPS